VVLYHNKRYSIPKWSLEKHRILASAHGNTFDLKKDIDRPIQKLKKHPTPFYARRIKKSKARAAAVLSVTIRKREAPLA